MKIGEIGVSKQRQDLIDFLQMAVVDFLYLEHADFDLGLSFNKDLFHLVPKLPGLEDPANLLRIDGRITAVCCSRQKIDINYNSADLHFRAAAHFEITAGKLDLRQPFKLEITCDLGKSKFEMGFSRGVEDGKPHYSLDLSQDGQESAYEARIAIAETKNYLKDLPVAVFSWLAIRDDNGLINRLMQPVQMRQISPEKTGVWQSFRDSDVSKLILRELSGIFRC